MDQAAVLTNIRVLERLGLGTPLLLVMILAMVVVPLPVFALDIFFTFNIVLALTVILVVIYVSRPLDFAVFPVAPGSQRRFHENCIAGRTCRR